MTHLIFGMGIVLLKCIILTVNFAVSLEEYFRIRTPKFLANRPIESLVSHL